MIAYLIEARCGLVKIGKARDPIARLKIMRAFACFDWRL